VWGLLIAQLLLDCLLLLEVVGLLALQLLLLLVLRLLGLWWQGPRLVGRRRLRQPRLRAKGGLSYY
jgi:hypothetical protein